jgi:RNA 2',3'-cyclic 3'-phosphodiesterase
MAPKLIPPEAKRCFFAAFPDPGTREAIHAQARARAADLGRRPVVPPNLHMTLLFVGDVPTARVEALAAAGAGLRLDRFRLLLDQVGQFGGSDAVWLGAQAGAIAAARTLNRALLERCRAAGFAIRSEAFHPHVTIFRNRQRTPRDAVLPVVPLLPPIAMAVDAYALVVSEPAPGGRRYVSVAAWPLG